MSDKPSKKVSMADMVKKQADKELKESGKISVGPTKFNELKDADPNLLLKNEMPVLNTAEDLAKEKDIKEYNANLHKLDPLYSSIEPVNNKILVRCFHMESKRSEGGLILEPDVEVDIPTRAGVGMKGKAKSPYAYQKRAVIVSAPSRYNKEDSPLKPGVVIQLAKSHLKAVSDTEGAVDMPFAFTHYSHQQPLPPKSIKNRHFGYLLIPVHEIEVILKNE